MLVSQHKVAPTARRSLSAGAAPHARFAPARVHAYKSGASSAADAREVVLPGALWLLAKDEPDVPVYGPGEHGFIMRALGSEPAQLMQQWGLVPRAGHPLAVRAQPAPPRRGPPRLPPPSGPFAALPASTCTGIVPFGAIVPYDGPETSRCTGIVPFEGLSLLADYGRPPPDVSLASAEDMMGVVLGAGLSGRQEGPVMTRADKVYETVNSFSPRRTSKVQFRCNRCGATNIKPINPHAWASGTVFAKCGKCNITHKLIDNLKLFHELSGPVFPAAASGLDDAAFGEQLPEALRLNLDMLDDMA